jgi:hypothetical protein
VRGTNVTQTVVTVPAATSTQLVRPNGRRTFLTLQNRGANDAALAFQADAVPTATATGYILYGNGGGLAMDGMTVSQDGISAYSTAGTTIVVLEG